MEVLVRKARDGDTHSVTRAGESMEYLIGVGVAVALCACAMLIGFDRDRVFYPTLVTVIATYYILFAVIGSSTRALVWFGDLRDSLLNHHPEA